MQQHFGLSFQRYTWCPTYFYTKDLPAELGTDCVIASRFPLQWDNYNYAPAFDVPSK